MKATVRNSTVVLTAKDKTDWKIAWRVRDAMFSKITVPKWIHGKQRFVSVIDRHWYAGSNPNTIIHNSRMGAVGGVLKSLGLKFKYLKLRESKDIDLNRSKVGLILRDVRTPRIHQKLHIEDFFSKDAPFYYLLGLKPGYGKTFTAIKIMHKLQQRTVIVVLSKYIDKWEKDLRDGFILGEKDVYKAVGLNGLVKLFKKKEDEIPKFIIIPTRTLSNYMDMVSKQNKDKNLILPENFARDLKIGNLVIDEGHNEFHVVYKFILNLDVRTLLLSGTFTSKSKYVRKYMEELFPLNERKDFSEHKKYVNFYRVIYNIRLLENEANWISSGSGYSNNKYESLLLGNARDRRMKELGPVTVKIPVNGKIITRKVLKPYNRAYRSYYIDMIIKMFKEHYVDKRNKGDKIIIYHSLVNSCSTILEILQEEFPKLKMVRYTQDDEYSTILSADVIVSTVLSSGEAFDIPNLTTVFMFINTVSEISNLQASGRLRDLKGKEMRFYYFMNGSLPKHNMYDLQRTPMFKDDAKTYNTIKYKE